ncbi:hypothetical protein NBT05_01145 [Aquimarina sp. ERC-38]|uniref:hypothetical protein n=1 Tax=Aquimarina sp. ERC-38 TaxID=2949996 RepID=UPI002246277E|nr:hypothetical protein [Aquimarina sp. ERC-38]UZO81097.1 hypothetical protein NBT05_01145 [Aquimarina sp. ERC-38]
METVPERHETEYIKEYVKKGYTHNFRVQDNVLKSGDADKDYQSNEITIVAEHRFEGMTNPSDMSILYVLETNDGNKGTVLVAYGPTADLEVAEFFKEIPKDQINDSTQLQLER